MFHVNIQDFMLLSEDKKDEDFMLFDINENEHFYTGDLNSLPEKYRYLTVQEWHIGFSSKVNRWVICLSVSLNNYA